MQFNVEHLKFNFGLDIPIKICFLSDIHFGGYWYKNNRKYYKCPPTLLNNIKVYIDYHSPDLLLVGGDLTDNDFSDPYPLFNWFSTLNVSRIYMVLGNHDITNNGYPACTDDILDAHFLYFQHNDQVKILRNESVILDEFGLNIIGIDDYCTNSFPNFYSDYTETNNGYPSIIMTHNPDTFSRLSFIQEHHKLFLFGHTHGHQTKFVGKELLIKIVKYFNKYKWFKKILNSKTQIQGWINCTKDDRFVSGLYECKNNYVYVSPGIGTHKPGRYNCPPTITFMDIK